MSASRIQVLSGSRSRRYSPREVSSRFATLAHSPVAKTSTVPVLLSTVSSYLTVISHPSHFLLYPSHWKKFNVLFVVERAVVLSCAQMTNALGPAGPYFAHAPSRLFLFPSEGLFDVKFPLAVGDCYPHVFRAL